MIELLVVIAIIGILSGLIIVSMSGATNSAKDARIKSEMDQLRSTAEIFRINNNYYNNTASAVNYVGVPNSNTTDFAASADGRTLLTDIQAQQSGALVINIDANTATASKYCVSKVLSDNTSIWCVDSAGNTGVTTGSCDSTNFDCLAN